MWTLGKDRTRGVCADVTGDARADVIRRIRELEVQLARATTHRFVGGEHERRRTERRRVDAEKDVVHDRVTDEHDLEHVARGDLGLRTQFECERIQRSANGRGEFFVATRIHHHVRDATHEIFTEADLRVHDTRTRNDFTRRQVDEVTGNGRRADVDGNTECGVDESRPYGDDLTGRASTDRHGCSPVTLVDRAVHGGQHMVRHGRLGKVMLLCNGGAQFFDRRHAVAERGLLHAHVIEAEVRIDDDLAEVEILAHDLLVHLTHRRDVDHDVATHLGHAPETVALNEWSLAPVVDLVLAGRRERLDACLDSPLRETADARGHLTTATNTATATHRIEIDAELARGIEHARTVGDLCIEARGREDDPRHWLVATGPSDDDDLRGRHDHRSERSGRDSRESSSCSPGRYR